MIFAKYQFSDIIIWDNLKKSIQSEEAYIDCAVVEIGEIEGGYAVDIMWFDNILQAFNEYEVFPDPCGVHTFAGCEDLYKKRYDENTNRL